MPGAEISPSADEVGAKLIIHNVFGVRYRLKELVSLVGAMMDTPGDHCIDSLKAAVAEAGYILEATPLSFVDGPNPLSPVNVVSFTRDFEVGTVFTQNVGAEYNYQPSWVVAVGAAHIEPRITVTYNNNGLNCGVKVDLLYFDFLFLVEPMSLDFTRRRDRWVSAQFGISVNDELEDLRRYCTPHDRKMCMTTLYTRIWLLWFTAKMKENNGEPLAFAAGPGGGVNVNNIRKGNAWPSNRNAAERCVSQGSISLYTTNTISPRIVAALNTIAHSGSMIDADLTRPLPPAVVAANAAAAMAAAAAAGGAPAAHATHEQFRLISGHYQWESFTWEVFSASTWSAVNGGAPAPGAVPGPLDATHGAGAYNDGALGAMGVVPNSSDIRIAVQLVARWRVEQACCVQGFYDAAKLVTGTTYRTPAAGGGVGAAPTDRVMPACFVGTELQMVQPQDIAPFAPAFLESTHVDVDINRDYNSLCTMADESLVAHMLHLSKALAYAYSIAMQAFNLHAGALDTVQSMRGSVSAQLGYEETRLTATEVDSMANGVFMKSFSMHAPPFTFGGTMSGVQGGFGGARVGASFVPGERFIVTASVWDILPIANLLPWLAPILLESDRVYIMTTVAAQPMGANVNRISYGRRFASVDAEVSDIDEKEAVFRYVVHSQLVNVANPLMIISKNNVEDATTEDWVLGPVLLAGIAPFVLPEDAFMPESLLVTRGNNGQLRYSQVCLPSGTSTVYLAQLEANGVSRRRLFAWPLGSGGALVARPATRTIIRGGRLSLNPNKRAIPGAQGGGPSTMNMAAQTSLQRLTLLNDQMQERKETIEKRIQTVLAQFRSTFSASLKEDIMPMLSTRVPVNTPVVSGLRVVEGSLNAGNQPLTIQHSADLQKAADQAKVAGMDADTMARALLEKVGGTATAETVAALLSSVKDPTVMKRKAEAAAFEARVQQEVNKRTKAGASSAPPREAPPPSLPPSPPPGQVSDPPEADQGSEMKPEEEEAVEKELQQLQV